MLPAAGDTVTERAHMDGKEERRHVGLAEAAPSSEDDGAHMAWAAQPINRSRPQAEVRRCKPWGRQAGQPTSGHDDHSHSRTLSLHCPWPCQGPRMPQLPTDQLQRLPQPPARPPPSPAAEYASRVAWQALCRARQSGACGKVNALAGKWLVLGCKPVKAL